MFMMCVRVMQKVIGSCCCNCCHDNAFKGVLSLWLALLAKSSASCVWLVGCGKL
jgi:hypothetical protein